MNKPIPFDRPWDYWLSRAHACRGNTRLMDALPLLRQAYRLSGHPEVELEIAETYLQMGCTYAALRILTDLVTKEGDFGQAYYDIGLIALMHGEEPLAEDALLMALALGLPMDLADNAQDKLNNYPWQQEVIFPRTNRAQTLCQAAVQARNEGDLSKAVRLLARSLKKGFTPRAAALTGEMLLKAGDAQGALPYLTFSCQADPSNLPCLLMAFQALCETGQKELVGKLLAAMPDMELNIQDQTLVTRMLCLSGNVPLAKERICSLLEGAPCSTDLLYLLASIQQAAGDLEGAQKTLKTIIAIDDQDENALLGTACFTRTPTPPVLYTLCARKEHENPALHRLIHGVTIALDGLYSYDQVRFMISDVWGKMSAVQRRKCDTDRQMLWHRAFYHYLSIRGCGRYVPSLLYRQKKYSRRQKRMERFIKYCDQWGDFHEVY